MDQQIEDVCSFCLRCQHGRTGKDAFEKSSRVVRAKIRWERRVVDSRGWSTQDFQNGMFFIESFSFNHLRASLVLDK
jgi:hypothetical protein